MNINLFDLWTKYHVFNDFLIVILVMCNLCMNIVYYNCEFNINYWYSINFKNQFHNLIIIFVCT